MSVVVDPATAGRRVVTVPVRKPPARQEAPPRPRRLATAAMVFLAGLMAITPFAIFGLAPTEATMGAVQRIMYVHVSMAWGALMGFVLVSVTGGLYLVRRNLEWDAWAQAGAEAGWLACTLTLVTGSLWASRAWNTWWTWDPRLTFMFILWILYAGYFLVRGTTEELHRRARLSAAVGLMGMLDVPLIVMATRWFRGIHPVSPQITPEMRAVLLLTACSFLAFFGVLVAFRRRQIAQERLLGSLEERVLNELT